MLNEYITIFVIGLLGGFSHCLGMCGGFVMMYSLNLRRAGDSSSLNKWQLLRAHVLYNSGRVFTYTLLGEIFGLLGGTLGFILAVKNLQGILELFAGMVMLLMGLDFAGVWPGRGADFFPGVNIFKRLVSGLFNNLTLKNLFLLGMVLGLIPCGLVYVAGAKAVATQSIVGGMMIMLFFGLGTIPALLILGISTEIISIRLRQYIYRLASVVLILMAVLTILRGIDALDWYHFYWLP